MESTGVEQRPPSNAARNVAVATCAAVSIGGTPFGLLCAWAAGFQDWQLMLGGMALAAYSVAGLLVAEKLVHFPTTFAIRCGLMWAGVGLSATTTAIAAALAQPSQSGGGLRLVDTTAWLQQGACCLALFFPLQVACILAFAVLLYRHAKSAR
jgi:hypothetical protein